MGWSDTFLFVLTVLDEVVVLFVLLVLALIVDEAFLFLCEINELAPDDTTKLLKTASLASALYGWVLSQSLVASE